jgi:hypothetical protein
MNLLNIDANAKTVKGQSKGYMTAVLYLAPADVSGFNVCPMAEMAGCIAGCLNTAGRGGMAPGKALMAPHGRIVPDNAIQRARIARTRLYFEDRPAFMAQLVKEIFAFIKKADKAGLTPAIRLNGTSDLPWHRIPVTIHGNKYDSVMDYFCGVQFYDYTKITKRAAEPRPKNYHITLSFSAANADYMHTVTAAAINTGVSMAVVFRNKQLPDTFLNFPVINGDETDLRFTDPAGVVVGLYAKGNARRDTSGFVIRN